MNSSISETAFEPMTEPAVNTTSVADRRFLTVKEVAQIFGVAPNTIWRWVRGGRFPAPVEMSAAYKRWRLSDIERYEKTLRT
jgi:prophage regulatory protein